MNVYGLYEKLKSLFGGFVSLFFSAVIGMSSYIVLHGRRHPIWNRPPCVNAVFNWCKCDVFF
jgi:hypothetical protein